MPSDVKFAVVNASSVASGTQDFTSSGFGTPKGAIFIMNGVTADGRANHGRYGIGAWDGSTSSWATGIADQDAAANAVTHRRASVASNRIIWIPSNTDTTWAELDYSTTITDGVRVSWVTSPGAGYHISCILIGGADASVNVGSFAANASTTPKTITTNIDQKLIFLSSVGNTSQETTSSPTGHYEYVHGWASSTGPVTMGPGIFFNDGAANGDPRGGYYDTHCGFFWVDNKYQVENYQTTSFDFTSKGTFHVANWWYYIAIDTSTKTIYNDVADTPTSTGDWARTGYGMTPEFIFGTMIGEGTTAGKNTENLQSTDLDGVACNSTFAGDGTNEFCYGCSTQDAAATMVARSVGTQSDIFLQWDDTASTKHTEGTISSFDSDGVTFNFTTAAAARYINFFAIGEAPAATLLAQDRAVSRRVFGRTFGRVN